MTLHSPDLVAFDSMPSKYPRLLSLGHECSPLRAIPFNQMHWGSTLTTCPRKHMYLDMLYCYCCFLSPPPLSAEPPRFFLAVLINRRNQCKLSPFSPRLAIVKYATMPTECGSPSVTSK